MLCYGVKFVIPYTGKILPPFYFALFTLSSEGQFETWQIELFIKNCMTNLNSGQTEDWANQSQIFTGQKLEAVYSKLIRRWTNILRVLLGPHPPQQIQIWNHYIRALFNKEQLELLLPLSVFLFLIIFCFLLDVKLFMRKKEVWKTFF